MKPAWEFYSQRRGITLEGLIRQGIKNYEGLEQFCNQRGVEPPTKELFQEVYDSVNRPIVVVPPKKKEVKPAATKKPEAASKKPAVKRTRRKKAAT